MNKKYMLIAAKLLEQAADSFSNHGCNDLSDDIRNILSKREWKELFKKYHQRNERTEHPKENCDVYQDDCMMSLMAHLLEEEAKCDNQSQTLSEDDGGLSIFGIHG